MKTKREFTWNRGCSCLPRDQAKEVIPAGAPVQERHGQFYVCPSFFSDIIVRHDATYYGCWVNPDNVEKE